MKKNQARKKYKAFRNKLSDLKSADNGDLSASIEDLEGKLSFKLLES